MLQDYMTIAELSTQIQAGSISPVHAVRHCLQKIERLNGTLAAFITVLADKAMAEARAAESEIRAGNYKGPLHGIPIGVKDMFDTAGIPTTAAFKHFAHRIPGQDAKAVLLLKEAGAIVIGKTNMHELAMGTTSVVSHFGAVHNPWNPECIAGGSSGGSAAALAADMCYATLDTDAVGSCRLPAACCGVVGFKPGFGVIPTLGILDGEPVDDVILALAHAAFMTRSIEDARFLLRALAPNVKVDDGNNDGAAWSQRAPENLRLGVMTNHQASDPVGRAFRSAIDSLEAVGFQVVEIEVPMDFRPMDISNIQADRARIGDSFTKADVLMLPTLTETVPTIAAATKLGPLALSAANTYFCNYYGLPALSLPCPSPDLPIGLQIVGPPGGEERILQVGAQFEKLFPGAHPNIESQK